MSIYVRDLQDRINEKAQKLAEERWKQHEKNFPFWDDNLKMHINGKQEVIDRYHLMQAMEKVVIARYKQEEINRISSEIMDTYENIVELKAQLDEVQNG